MTDKIHVKRIGQHDLPTPRMETLGSAAYDLRAANCAAIFPGHERLVQTGFAWEIPPGSVGLVVPRSGLGARDGIVLGNLVGVIDSDFRGEVMVKLWNRKNEGEPFKVSEGDRIAQMMIVQLSQLRELYEVDELSPSARGEGGFGSTGKQ